MRVLHVITGLGRGGAEAMLARLLAPLREFGVESHVVTMLPGGALESEVRAEASGYDSLGMRMALPNPLALYRLHRLINRFDPDIVHGWMYHASLASLLAAPRRRQIVAIRQSLHDMRHEKLKTKAVIHSLAHLSRRADRILYASQVSRQHHEAIGYPADRAVVLANGFDITRFRPSRETRLSLRAQAGFDEDAIVLGSVGRWHTVKNHALLIKSFSHVRRRHANLRLMMAGTGINASNKALRDLLAAAGIAPHDVALLGERTDPEAVMTACDVFANPSRSEAFPNVLAEAMACGTPCVATDVGDTRAIVDEFGIVVPPGNVAAFATAIHQMVVSSKSERQAIGEAARSSIVARYGIRAIAEQHANLYHNIVHDTPKTTEY